MFVLLRVRPVQCRSIIRPRSTGSARTMVSAHFRPSQLDNLEDLEDYKPTGFHPVAIGDTLAEGRYRIIHKLGSGGSSTVWLARNRTGKLVTLKVMRADVSSKPVDEIPEIVVPRKILDYVRAQDPVPCSNIQVIEDYFIENGPNGSHFCLVSDFAGPSISSMSDSPGRMMGSRRLRGDLARKIARQVAGAVELMHSAGFVHGDLTTSNILLRLDDSVKNWSDNYVYINFDQPETEEVATRMDGPLEPSLPARLFAPIDNALLTHSSFLKEDALIIDFGQSFRNLYPPTNYEPATILHYMPPEGRFERNIDTASDIWALACTIFEIRAGFPLFEAFHEDATVDEVLKEMVATLGKLPEPWWDAFENRDVWFDEDAMPNPYGLLPVVKTSIEQQLAIIGTQDDPPATGTDGPMMERVGTKLDEIEIQLLRDLLEKMLRYMPQERINIREVISHPWFSYN